MWCKASSSLSGYPLVYHTEELSELIHDRHLEGIGEMSKKPVIEERWTELSTVKRHWLEDEADLATPKS